MLNYGRESLRRNATLICYTFYKNVLITLPPFFYGFFTGMSGLVLFDPYLILNFNTFQTSIPIMIVALFDKEFHGDYLADNPYLYIHGMMGNIFNALLFWKWMAISAYQSLVVL